MTVAQLATSIAPPIFCGGQVRFQACARNTGSSTPARLERKGWTAPPGPRAANGKCPTAQRYRNSPYAEMLPHETTAATRCGRLCNFSEQPDSLSRKPLRSWDLDDFDEVACLLTSELASNAVLHAGTAFQIIVDLEPPDLLVEVVDFAPSLRFGRTAQRPEVWHGPGDRGGSCGPLGSAYPRSSQGGVVLPSARKPVSVAHVTTRSSLRFRHRS